MSCSEKGSTPLELVITLTLLLLPIAPLSQLYLQLSEQLAAESIARNSLRAAVLADPENPERQLEEKISQLANAWQVTVANYELSCLRQCEILTLRVVVGGATGIQSAGIYVKP